MCCCCLLLLGVVRWCVLLFVVECLLFVVWCVLCVCCSLWFDVVCKCVLVSVVLFFFLVGDV